MKKKILISAAIVVFVALCGFGGVALSQSDFFSPSAKDLSELKYHYEYEVTQGPLKGHSFAVDSKEEEPMKDPQFYEIHIDSLWEVYTKDNADSSEVLSKEEFAETTKFERNEDSVKS